MAQGAAAYNFASRNLAFLMTGFGISSFVFLILTAQVWIYFWRRRIRSQESKQSKALNRLPSSVDGKIDVALQVAGSPARAITALISRVHTMEFEDVSHFKGHMLTEWALNTAIGSLTTSLVHGIFIRRVFILEKGLYGRWRISFVLIAFCFMEQVFGLLGAICIFELHNGNCTMVIWSISISFGCSIINDVLIAGTLAYILHKHRTVSPRTNQIITKLIIFCSQTGLITTVAASIAVGLWAVRRFDISHLHMSFPIGGLYATCLLANSIARESYLQPQTVHETEDFEINFARSTRVIHVGLPDNRSGHQETMVKQGGTDSSKASSC
ncbi:hypothetical protein BDR07DRAFT_1613401 [Suillus spraguei]|nr:hypothetical protein BDR07DRAFT_1613401 [Suillus spraguei]